MNAHCERIIGSIRREALDHVLIMNEAHARQVLAAYQQHYNEHRPHRARNQLPPGATSNPPPDPTSKSTDSCAPVSSAARSTSIDAQLDQQRRFSEPLRQRWRASSVSSEHLVEEGPEAVAVMSATRLPERETAVIHAVARAQRPGESSVRRGLRSVPLGLPHWHPPE
jgi:hypothetical protein